MRSEYDYADGHGIDEIATGLLGEADHFLNGDIRTGDVFAFLDYLIGEYNVLNESY